MNSYILFYIGRKICLCFKFNGGSFIYLKLKDFDISFFFTLGSFLKFLKSIVESSYYPHLIGLWISVGVTSLSWSGYLFESGYYLELIELLMTKVVKLTCCFWIKIRRCKSYTPSEMCLLLVGRNVRKQVPPDGKREEPS